ncbi:MAG: hypothetical protein KME35_05565 [Aphanocapsa sp. GSE-SYN-MK-11-07L]|nr:hypothetical protein [Aphanocapsa sp. GSE-SYN-MK-11-07L]
MTPADAKPCDLCQQPVQVRYRIQVNQGGWILACPTCQAHCCHLPGYRYGGTWKSRSIKPGRR